MVPIRTATFVAGFLTYLAVAGAPMTAAAQSVNPRAATGDRWAAVNSNGTLARGKGAVSVVKADVGRYIIAFNRNIKDCIYVTTIGQPGNSGTESPGTTTAHRAHQEGKKVEVKIFDPKGVAADRGFFLHVVCQ